MAFQSYVQLDAPAPYARYSRAAAFTFPATANQLVNPFIYDNRLADDATPNYVNGIYTCPIAGLYYLRATLSINVNINVNCNVAWYQNGSPCLMTNLGTGQSGANIWLCSGIINANANDLFQVAVTVNQASAICRTGNIYETCMQIAWISGGGL